MRHTALLVWLVLGAGACARPAAVPGPVGPSAPPAVAAGLPPVPTVTGPLALAVVYPPAGSTVDVRDSTFLFGSAGTGAAAVSINGQAVRVWPNGSWLAWLRVPADTLMQFRIVATAGADSAVAVHELRRPRRFRAPAAGLWVDTTSFRPAGRVWWPANEPLPITVRAAEGATARLILPDGVAVPLLAVPTLPEVAEAVRAFDRDPQNLVRQAGLNRYFGSVRGLAIGEPAGPMLDPTARSAAMQNAVLEVARGGDTLRVRWPLQVTVLNGPDLAELDDDRGRQGGTDALTVGRAVPEGTYHWFFPAGTRAAATGRINGDVRLRLSATSDAWVAAADVRSLGPGVALGPAVVSSMTTTLREGNAVIRIPVAWRVPYQVEQTPNGVRLRLYGSVSDLNWVRYGRTVPLVDRITWRQATADEVEIEATLVGPLWGYRLSWERNDLLLELRPRPAIDPARPLEGRRIAVDAGHPPGGAQGPSGLTEAEANLAVARLVRDLLEAEGARVFMTRDDERPVDLWPRVRLADSLDAELEVSIHNNALPDGVNPFTNNGSSVFYFHPGSIPLARLVQEELVARLGLRDLGFARGDLALVRGTWMPSILTEGLFMMLPDQEAALRTAAGTRRYAEAVVAGIRRFLAGDGL